MSPCRHDSTAPSHLVAAATRATRPLVRAHEVIACLGFTCSVRTALRPPRKGQTFDDPRRLPSYRDILTCFRRKDPSPTRLVWEDLARLLAHRFAFVDDRRPCQYLRAIPRFGTAISLGLGRVSQFVLRLPEAHDRDASDRFLLPNTLRTSTRTRLLPDHRQDLRPAYTKEVCASVDRGIERLTTLESLQRIAWLRGEFSSRLSFARNQFP